MSKVGSNVTLINVMRIPGLNTLGISLARIDYAPQGENPPHTHPRATEILTVLEGTLYVGFVTSNQQDNKLFTKMLNKGDVSYSQRGSSTSSSTLALTSQQLQLPHLAARTLVLLPFPMQFSDRNHQLQMMFLPRRFRWTRRLWIGSKLSFGRTTTTKSKMLFVKVAYSCAISQ